MTAQQQSEINRLYRHVLAAVSLVAWQIGGEGDEILAYDLFDHCIPNSDWQADDYRSSYNWLADLSDRVRAAYPLDGHIYADGLLIAREYTRQMAVAATGSDPSEGSEA